MGQNSFKLRKEELYFSFPLRQRRKSTNREGNFFGGARSRLASQ
jgi:hypothetical protein